MRLFITGSTGFIGRHLVRRLSQRREDELFALVRNASSLNLIPSAVHILRGDICDFSSCQKALAYSKPNILFHCAGFVGEDRNLLWQINVEGTKNIAEAAFKEGVKRVVYLSSVSVNSANPSLPLREEEPFCASSLYGESKIAAEKIIWEYAKEGLNVVILRPCMVYGEDEPHMLGRILWLLKRRLYPIIGKGNWRWHLLYVENLVEAMLLASEIDYSGPYNIADRCALSAQEVFTLMAEVLKVPPPWHLPKKIAYCLGGAAELLNKVGFHIPFSRRSVDFLTKDRLYSIEKAVEIMGYNPPWDVKEALCLSVKRYWANHYA